jgi:hypothetical protein
MFKTTSSTTTTPVMDHCSSGSRSNSSNTADTTSPPPTATVTVTTTSSSTITSVSLPTLHDVLCGRGKATRLHPGNLVYNQLLKDCYHDYQQTPKGSKIDICQKIASLVAERGGRFLEKMTLSSSSSSSSFYYVELQGDRVIAKIAQGFRDLRVSKENGIGVVGGKSRNGCNGSVVAKKVTSSSTASSALIKRSNVSSVMIKSRDHHHHHHHQNNDNNPNQSNDHEIPGQPAGRLSFTERVKLFQKEQEKMMRQQQQQRYEDEEMSSNDDDDDDDDDDESEEAEQEEEEDLKSAGEQENESEEELPVDVEHDNPDSGVNMRDVRATSSCIINHQPSFGDGGDVSETETEDSFPLYRTEKKVLRDPKRR